MWWTTTRRHFRQLHLQDNKHLCGRGLPERKGKARLRQAEARAFRNAELHLFAYRRDHRQMYEFRENRVMNADNRLNRRDFIKTSVVTGGALLAATAIPGQAVMPHPVEGMRDCILKLQSAGVSQSDIDLLVRRNPAWLIGLAK